MATSTNDIIIFARTVIKKILLIYLTCKDEKQGKEYTQMHLWFFEDLKIIFNYSFWLLDLFYTVLWLRTTSWSRKDQPWPLLHILLWLIKNKKHANAKWTLAPTSQSPIYVYLFGCLFSRANKELVGRNGCCKIVIRRMKHQTLMSWWWIWKRPALSW